LRAWIARRDDSQHKIGNIRPGDPLNITGFRRPRTTVRRAAVYFDFDLIAATIPGRE
jgi:hypothetical protein